MNYSAAICYFPKITVSRARNLLTRFSDPKSAFLSEFDDLIAAGFNDEVAHEFIVWRDGFKVEQITEEIIASGIKTVSILDDDYPFLLKQITDPPPVIFYRGTLKSEIGPAISVVGTRRCTIYGRQATDQIVTELAKNNVTIVSGLALGIDGIAHDAALRSGGNTLAVLGSGVDRRNVYPSSHLPLAEKIIANGGAVLSEYPPGFKPTQYSFPARNRIIAGLSHGTLVAEAPLKSGALITAARCLDYNRDVYAFPHPTTSTQGAGGNELLKRGAMLVTSAEDILNALEITNNFREAGAPIKTKPQPADSLESQICSLLSEGPRQIDELIKLSGSPSNQVTGKLTIMEMRGLVANAGGMNYILL